MSATALNQDALLKLGEALKAENHPLGDVLVDYAGAWKRDLDAAEERLVRQLQAAAGS